MKKLLSTATSVLLATAVLSGCGSSASTTEQDSETLPATETASEDETLTVWCWDPNFNIYAMEEAEKIYQKDHPNFELDIQENIFNDIETKLVVAGQSGDYSTLPDIILMQDYSYEKFVTNYPDMFADLTDSGINFANFTEGKVASSTIDGRNYGVPFDNGVSIFAVRTDMLAEAGFTPEDFMDITWTEFIEKARVVKEKVGVPMLTASGGSEMVMQMLQTTGQSVYEDGTINLTDNEALAEAMRVYKQLVDEGLLVEYTDWDQYIASMNTGKAAGVIQGGWIMASIQAATDQSGDWAIVNIPSLEVEGGTNYTAMGGASWAVTSGANQELAVDFLNSTFGSSTELYDTLLGIGAITCYTPAINTDAYQQESEFFGGQKVYADLVEFSSQIPPFTYGPYFSEVRSALTDAVTNVIQSDADIATEINAAQEAVDFSISE